MGEGKRWEDADTCSGAERDHGARGGQTRRRASRVPKTNSKSNLQSATPPSLTTTSCSHSLPLLLPPSRPLRPQTTSTMSATTTPNDTPIGTPIQPLHNPGQAAHVVVPQAPLGNATNGLLNQAPGMGAKALLAKKFAKSQ